MKNCGTCYYRNSTWSLQNREMSASCEHANAPSDALLKLHIGAGSVVSAPVWCPLDDGAEALDYQPRTGDADA